MANQAKQYAALDADDANQVMEFFKNFADPCHQGKEEDQQLLLQGFEKTAIY